MYIDLIVNGAPKRMYFGYISNVNTQDAPNSTYLNKSKSPKIEKKGTSFRTILGGNRPTEIKDVNGNVFATRYNSTPSKLTSGTIAIEPFSAPSNLKILPGATARAAEKTTINEYVYRINSTFGKFMFELNVSVDSKNLFNDINSQAPTRDFMLFATDEIIDGKRTIMYLSENKYTIINKDSGKCFGKMNDYRTVLHWYALNYTDMSINFDIKSGILEDNLQLIPLFFLGTNKQAGSKYVYPWNNESGTVGNFNYGNLIEFNDANKTFFTYHFTNPPNSNYTTIMRGGQTRNYNSTLYEDIDNPIPPDIDEPPELPLPEPEDPTDPDNPDNPDNLEPDPSDPIAPPTPSESPAFTAKLITAYNLSSDNLSSLANEMWTTSFYDNIVKMFTNPMDCLISLAEYPIDIPSTVTENIKLGNVEMETAGRVIKNPFVTVDLGYVNLEEKFNSYLDYMNTNVQIFLPFIGFEQLSIDYMNSQLQLQYNVDIMSGNCVAILYAISYNSNLQSVVGQWNGNMAYSIPLSGRDFSQMASSLWNTAMSAGSVIASSRIPTMAASGFTKGSPGGFGLPSLGSVSDLGNNIINTIEAANATTSGGHLSANAGHLGSLTPYLIITRPVQKINANYYASFGRTLDAYTPFSALSGYTKVKSCNLSIPSATQDEILAIDKLLKEGVIF